MSPGCSHFLGSNQVMKLVPDESNTVVPEAPHIIKVHEQCNEEKTRLDAPQSYTFCQ